MLQILESGIWRVRQEGVQYGRLQDEKRVIWKKWNIKNVQYEKSQREKIATQKKCNMRKVKF